MTSKNAALAYGDQYYAHIRSLTRSSESLLFVSILNRAVADLESSNQVDREESIRLFSATSGDWKNHLEYLCAGAGVDPDSMRERLRSAVQKARAVSEGSGKDAIHC